MFDHSLRRAPPILTAGALALLLCGCATGQGIFVAGSDGGGSSSFAQEESGQTLEFSQESGVLAASGNALLPGARPYRLAALDSAGSGLGGALGAPLAGVAAPVTNAVSGVLTQGVTVPGLLNVNPGVTLAGQPLSGIRGGAPNLLANTTATVLPSLTVNGGPALGSTTLTGGLTAGAGGAQIGGADSNIGGSTGSGSSSSGGGAPSGGTMAPPGAAATLTQLLSQLPVKPPGGGLLGGK